MRRTTSGWPGVRESARGGGGSAGSRFTSSRRLSLSRSDSSHTPMRQTSGSHECGERLRMRTASNVLVAVAEKLVGGSAMTALLSKTTSTLTVEVGQTGPHLPVTNHPVLLTTTRTTSSMFPHLLASASGYAALSSSAGCATWRTKPCSGTTFDFRPASREAGVDIPQSRTLSPGRVVGTAGRKHRTEGKTSCSTTHRSTRPSARHPRSSLPLPLPCRAPADTTRHSASQ